MKEILRKLALLPLLGVICFCVLAGAVLGGLLAAWVFAQDIARDELRSWCALWRGDK